MRIFMYAAALAAMLVLNASGGWAQQSGAPKDGAQTQPSDQNRQGGGPETRKAEGAPDSPPQHQVIGPPNAGPVAETGEGMNLPGASTETFPAKFSPEQAAKDEMPIMARPVPLTAEQRRAIWDAVGNSSEAATPAGEKIFAEPGVFLPSGVEAAALPDALKQEIPELNGLKYLKSDDKVLLVAPSNGIVRDVIEE